MLYVLRQMLAAVALGLALFFVTELSLQLVKVEGFSMGPTLDDGEHAMVNKLAYFQLDLRRLAQLVPFWDVEEGQEKHLPFTHTPKRGDVIVFRAPEGYKQLNSKGLTKNLVKRIIGLPGERLEIREGAVYINGVRLDEPYLTGIRLTGSMECIPNSVGCALLEGQYFVMGDNRSKSNDSRNWGAVALEDIVGKVWFRY